MDSYYGLIIYFVGLFRIIYDRGFWITTKNILVKFSLTLWGWNGKCMIKKWYFRVIYWINKYKQLTTNYQSIILYFQWAFETKRWVRIFDIWNHYIRIVNTIKLEPTTKFKKTSVNLTFEKWWLEVLLLSKHKWRTSLP